jgi:hypothetical protein
MPCLHCRAPKTIEAHLIPRAFVMEVKRDPGEKHLILHAGKDGHATSHTGVYDKDILCARCDNVLGRYESYAFDQLKTLRSHRFEAGKIVTVEPLDGDVMVRFAAGIAWKYTATTKARGRIDIGPHAATLAEVALGGAPIPESLDLAMIRILELDGDVYYYRTPFPDRKEGVNVVRFCVGGFLFFLKIDKRRPGQMLPEDCWLRGRSTGSFLTAPGEYIEEAQMHAQLAGRASVRGFFHTMRQRSAARGARGSVPGRS